MFLLSSFRNNLFLPTLTSKVVGGIQGSDLRTQYTASLFLLSPPPPQYLGSRGGLEQSKGHPAVSLLSRPSEPLSCSLPKAMRPHFPSFLHSVEGAREPHRARPQVGVSTGPSFARENVWEEKRGNRIEGRINGVTSKANSAFTNISSSDSPIPGEAATTEAACHLESWSSPSEYLCFPLEAEKRQRASHD